MNSNHPNSGPVEPDHQLVIAEMQRKLQLYEEAMSSVSPEQEEEDVIDLREYWNVLVRRKWTVILTLLVLLIGTFIVTAMQTPMYRATTVLQIERDTGDVLEYKGVTAEESSWSSDFYQTQYELLQSRALASRVIDQLGLSSQSATDSEDEEGPGFIAEMIGGIKDGIRAILAPEEETTSADQEALPPDLESSFLGGLSIQPVRNSRLVKVQYTSDSAKDAALIANTLASSYVDMTLERRFEASTYAKSFLDDRIKQVRADLEDSEEALAQYNQERGIINQDDKLGILMGKLREMNSALVGVETSRIEEESRFQEMLGTSDASLSQFIDNQVVQNLKQRKSGLQSEYQELLKIYKPKYPKMVQLQNQIDQVNEDMRQEIENIRSVIKAKYQAKLREEAKLTESIDNTRKEIMTLQQRSTDFQTLKREVDTNRELYDGLLQRMKEVGVAAGITTNNISIVDQANIPRYAFSPSLRKNMMIAMMLGLFGGVLLAFLFESLDDSLKSSEDLEKLIDKPVLGIIPLVAARESREFEDLSLFAHQSPTSAFAEAYRSMRTALMFSTNEGAPKVLQVTSINAGEGKTTTVVSTAINFTQTGGDVLLIDADLRNPSLHKVFGAANNMGLANYLAGDIDPAKIARKTNIDHLYVIPSGPVPPNPAELLSGAKMMNLVSIAARRFDYVIIDSPPVLGLADSLILADIARATLLVVSANSTRKGALEAGMKRLQHAKACILGTVLTKFEMGKAGYGYDYHYSYEYGGAGEASELKT